METIERQPWIAATAEAVQAPVRNVLTGLGATKDILHGTWLGHPVHPALTDIPIGAWTMALVFDALDAARGDRAFADAAEVAIGTGLAGALAAALAGVADWSEIDGRARSLGLVHGLLNLGATGLFTASLLARRRRSRGLGMALSAAGAAVAFYSANLGGRLVFGNQIGVDHTATADQNEPEQFVAVMNERDLHENMPAVADANGVAVMLVRIGGEIHAIADTCTHLGGPLHEGKLDGDTIRCPWHGSEFCVRDGALRRGPATFPECVFDVRVHDGQIELRRRRDR
ncbi:MAG TPA: DUF2231 domain-containing protein [Thermoanaerobaculia bacterium]|nr:DUF2231 domain-containing protein [Thermoanaerobaculia bacterium]